MTDIDKLKEKHKGELFTLGMRIAELERIEELYEAGCKHWGPVYEELQKQKEALEAENLRLRRERDDALDFIKGMKINMEKMLAKNDKEPS